jgi:hypothetical protein
MVLILALINKGKTLKKLVFASGMSPQKTSMLRFLLLVESIREFGGSLSHAPILCLSLDGKNELPERTRNQLSALNVEFINVKRANENSRFPFLRKTILSAQAEAITEGRAARLTWLDSDTIVVKEPKELLLPENIYLGYRPVHHTVIGSRFDEPLDLFWKLIYRYCKVPEDRVFPMMTHVDGMQIRPYFNAGLLVVRPERQLLQTWCNSFLKTYKKAEFQELYEKDTRYTVFMHQAVLAGTILSTLTTNEMVELPTTYNYPLHLFREDVTDDRPSSLEEVVTFRYENFFDDSDWSKKIPAKEKLRQWIAITRTGLSTN